MKKLPLPPLGRPPTCQGRLPEIEELQRQIAAAHEELSEQSFKAAEDRSAASAREQALLAERVGLESKLGASEAARGRAEREAAAAKERAAAHEKQLEELYELCTSLQGSPEPGGVWVDEWEG